MEFEPLTRSQSDYLWAVEQMASCYGLLPHEEAIILDLYNAALVSVDAFDKARQTFMIVMPGPLASIIRKCRMQGIGKEWPQHASQS